MTSYIPDFSKLDNLYVSFAKSPAYPVTKTYGHPISIQSLNKDMLLSWIK